MAESEFLGSQKVRRSAYAVKEATALTIYLGVCERDNRPVRFEFPYDMGPTAEIPCFAGCTLPVKCQRLHAVTTTLECDGSCRSARRPWCECGCGGINHGNMWTKGALLDRREIVDSEIAKYRAEQVKIAERREVKREAVARAARSAFERWAADHQDLVAALEPWWEHRNDYDWSPKHWGAHILDEFARQLHWAKPKPLTDRQIELAHRILGEVADKQRQDAERQAWRAAKPGAGDQSALVPGVYKLNGEVYVVKGNQAYKHWRKHDPGQPQPADARLYAKRMVETRPRRGRHGDLVPAFELAYAPGVIFDLALADRLPLDEAQEMSRKFRACIYCGRDLDAGKSIDRAIGPVCIKYFGPVLDAQRQAS